ncbi:MAG TPA: DinB family protein [Capsulimonadaceae bacterium]|nr:DinB family protein [Capsulimonadaceae bacterium]
MLVEYEFTKNYLMGALEGAPDVFERFLAGATQEEIDRRPDPQRFTIREIMAHLADWEPIYFERLRRVRDENQPLLPNYDEGQLAIEHDYAHKDLAEQIHLYRAGRSQITGFLKDLKPSDWQRTGNRPEIGMVTLEALAILIPLHDSYHLRQIAEWRGK